MTEKNVVPCCEEMEIMVNQTNSDYRIAFKQIGSFKSESGVYLENVYDKDSGMIMKLKYCPFCRAKIEVK